MTRTKLRWSRLSLLLLTPLCWISLRLALRVRLGTGTWTGTWTGTEPEPERAIIRPVHPGAGLARGNEARPAGRQPADTGRRAFGSVRRSGDGGGGRAGGFGVEWGRTGWPWAEAGRRPRRTSADTVADVSHANEPSTKGQRQRGTPHQWNGTFLRSRDSPKSGDSPRDNGALPAFQPAGYRWRKDGPGEMGRPVVLPPEDQRRAGATFHAHRFNVVISDRVALNRTLPDVRPPRCRVLRYPGSLPSTSVIIVFHNEALSTLLRTVTSVVGRSPAKLLHEIILVDDASDAECDWLLEPLEEFVARLPVRVKVERLGTRQGIVAARHRGVAVSSGEVLTFLDSHCECTLGWLEPLLHRIARDRTRVVSPVIDSISDDTFEYSAPSGMPLLGGFSWLPEFQWMAVPAREQRRVRYDIHLPLRTPTIAGGLLSVHRDFFLRLGGYDPGMRIWGGENLELSFKAWQCGGSLEIVPCSHVGHVFRSGAPYDFPGPGGAQATVLRNNRRLLDVWADDRTRALLYAITPAYRTAEPGDVAGQAALRHRLGCKDFRWYLANVYPEHNLPLEFQALGAIKNLAVNLCLDDVASRADGRQSQGGEAALDLCHGNGPGQVFALNLRSQLQHDRHCLTDVEGEGDATARLRFCVGDDRPDANQKWSYNTKDMSLVNRGTGRCLDVIASNKDDGLFLATANECNSALSQQWTMHNITLSGFS